MRLSDSSNKFPIPYRESKLTRILRTALEGKSRVVIICNITPSSFVFEETLSTLKFATRAKKIVQKATRNEIVDDKMLIKKYENEIRNLQRKLKEMESLLNSQNAKKNVEMEVAKVREELSSVVNEKKELGSKLEVTIQEKIGIEGELERLKSKILVSENISLNPINVGLVDLKSQERRRHRVSMHREMPKKVGRHQSEVVDIKSIESLRKAKDMATPEKIPEAPKKIKNREELIIEKLEENWKKLSEKPELYEFSVIISADEVLEIGEEKVQNKIEEYESYIKTLVSQITRKDEEIEMLKDELDLCRGNFNRLQKLIQQRNFN